MADPTTDSGPSQVQAFAYCERMARSHYENFPVASRLIPRERRPWIYAVYAFARTADDMADEGTLFNGERLRRLDEWEARLDACYDGQADHPVFIALMETIRHTGIPRAPLAALLRAFRMDVTQSRFSTFEALLEYCSCSANPVGQLVLYIFQDANPEKIQLSDAICTGLQLANFWQDVSVDLQKGRIYLPLEDFGRFEYTESDLIAKIVDKRFRDLIRFQVERTGDFFRRGAPLIGRASRELRLELGLTVGGGNAILKKIGSQDYDVLSHRPTLSMLDKTHVLLNALFGRIS